MDSINLVDYPNTALQVAEVSLVDGGALPLSCRGAGGLVPRASAVAGILRRVPAQHSLRIS